MFDWMGYREVPHCIRYAIVLFMLTAPIYAFFFLMCCVQNDIDDDPEEEAKFLKRFEKWERRKQERLEEAKKMKWD